MMSKKWTFSLTSLITILVLAFVVSSAPAGVLGDKFSTTISLANPSETDTDGMIVGDNQFAAAATTDADAQPVLKVVFDKRVTLGTDGTAAAFAPEDVKITVIDKETGTTSSITIAADDIKTDPQTGTAGDEDLPNPWAMFTVDLGDSRIDAGSTVLVTIAAGAVENAEPGDVIAATVNAGDSLGKNKAASLQFDVVAAQGDMMPRVVSVEDYPPIVLGPGTHDAFSFKVTLSEKPKEFKKDHIDASNATISGDPVFAGTMTNAASSTEATDLVYQYLVTLAPKYESKDDIVIKIKSFEDTSSPANKSLVSSIHRVKVNSDANKKVGQHGTEVNLPKDVVVPANGYLVVARDAGKSYVRNPGDAKHGSGDIARRTNAKDQTYNLTGLSLGVNLEGFLIRGGTLDIVSPNAGLVITEIMWATDAGSPDRQWIEIANTTAGDIKFGDKTHKIVRYEGNEVLPDVSTVVDRVSTLYKGTNIWSIAGKGQPGRTEGKIVEQKTAGEGATKNIAIDIEIVPTDRLISMERRMLADGTYADGTMKDSWAQSMLPAQNFKDEAGGLFVGSPGTSAINPVPDAMPTPEPEAPAPTPVAMADEIKITEIMVNTGNGRYPQWIELTSMATGEVSLEGWEMVIDNAIDTDVLGGGNAITVGLSGVTLDVSMHEGNLGQGQSALVVAWAAPRMSDNIRAERIVNVATQLGQTRRYQLLSYNGFRITLVPPDQGAIAAFGDVAGNLDEDWEIPMDGRSSIIRHETSSTGAATLGTDANGWKLASSTDLVTGQESYYGDDEDDGTPGHDSGGPLPVELSHFRPARDKATGAVVITWATQSELNNAGFFIKRSQQRDGEFKVINATMVPGAGTTSEKQFYTYTDTTAQPNIVYYYQIEDVSLDGNRQTLTRGIRLKGHIGAAGKLTSTWGEIKASNE